MAKKKEINFEESMGELESLLAQIADSDTGLDQAVTLYARAAQLLDDCNQALRNAEVRIEEIDAKMKDLEGSDGL